MKANLRLIARMLLIVALLSSVLACQNAGQSSGIQSGDRAEDEKNPELSLLRKYGWTVEGEPKETTMELPNPVDKLLATRLYVLASKRIGLDFSNQAGKTLPLRTYKVINEVERGHDIRAHLLVADKKIVGAWLSVEGSESAPNIYALNVNPHKRN
ncbi:MAG TPA: DUF4830 domain-containing protein [Pyrinomonadaceae bacterium]|jgi:hypothetical protein